MAAWIAAKSIAAFVVKKYDEGVEFGLLATKMTPGYFGTHRALAANLSELGRKQEAKTSVQMLLRLFPGMNNGLLRKIMPFKNPQDMQRFCDALARAGLPE